MRAAPAFNGQERLIFNVRATSIVISGEMSMPTLNFSYDAPALRASQTMDLVAQVVSGCGIPIQITHVK